MGEVTAYLSLPLLLLLLPLSGLQESGMEIKRREIMWEQMKHLAPNG